MNDEFAVVVESKQQEFAATLGTLEGGTDDLDRGCELRGRVRTRLDDDRADDFGFELATNRFDLGELRHAATIASGPVADVRVFTEVVEAAAVLRGLTDVARVEAWGSSALSVWREAPDAAAIDSEFVSWLDAQDSDDARLAGLATAYATGADAGRVAALRSALADPPGWAFHVGTAVAVRAWRIAETWGESVGITYSHSDGSELSLLADIGDGRLGTIVAAPGAEELFDDAEDLVAPETLDVVEAAGAIVAAWRSATAAGLPQPESLLVNLVLAHDRLANTTEVDLADLLIPRTPPEVSDLVDVEEIADSNAWALAIIERTLGAGDTLPADSEVLDPLRQDRHANYPAEEAEAFGALEWADWVGAITGLVRAGVGADAHPAALVDYINRSPDVASSIPKKDRAYFEWAFQHVVALWHRHGLVDDDRRLTTAGHSALPAALRTAWAVA